MAATGPSDLCNTCATKVARKIGVTWHVLAYTNPLTDLNASRDAFTRDRGILERRTAYRYAAANFVDFCHTALNASLMSNTDSIQSTPDQSCFLVLFAPVTVSETIGLCRA